nr:hypothetical protein [Streptomyces agglomeratus]
MAFTIHAGRGTELKSVTWTRPAHIPLGVRDLDDRVAGDLVDAPDLALVHDLPVQFAHLLVPDPAAGGLMELTEGNGVILGRAQGAG